MKINTIYHEDNIKTLSRMSENFIDLVVTSPPYDGLRKYHGFSFDVDSVIKLLFSRSKPGGVVVWVVGDQTKRGSESGTSFRTALKFIDAGFNLHDTMIYRKKKYVPLTHNRYEQEFEYMFVFSKGRTKTFNALKVPCKNAGKSIAVRTFYQKPEDLAPSAAHKHGVVANDKIRGNIWTFSTTNEKYKHPAMFPFLLAHDHILTWSNEHDLVYDPFCGSGTTCAAAKMLNRNFIGSEVSAEFVSEAKRRIRSIKQ